MRLPNVYLSLLDRGGNIDQGNNQPEPPVGCNCTVADILGWFDVTAPAYGAVADATLNISTGFWSGTDNSPAFLACFEAAIDFNAQFPGRFGTVYIPPAPKGQAYLLATPFELTLASSNLSSASALHLRILGCGADGPIVVGVNDPTKYGFNLYSDCGEWFQGEVDGLCFIGDDLKFSTGHASALSFARFGCNVGRWAMRNMQAIGGWAEESIFELATGNFHCEHFQDSGTSSGSDSLAGAGFVFFNKTQVSRLSGLFSFGEYNYQGVDNGLSSGYGLGSHEALIALDPSVDTSWGQSTLEAGNIHGTSRNGWVLNCYPRSGSQGATSVWLHDFRTVSASPGCVQAGFTESLTVERGAWNAGGAYWLGDLYGVSRAIFRDINVQSGSTAPKVRADNACGTVDIDNCPGITNISVASPSLLRQNTAGAKGLTVGANVTSGTTIAPTSELFHLTGTTTVTAITLPTAGWTGVLYIICDGNVTVMGTAYTAGTVAVALYDGSSWTMK